MIFASEVEEEKRAKGGAKAMPKRSVLIVDDDESIGRLLSSALRTLGFRCDYARDASEALTMAQSSKYDVAVVDLHLPGPSGLEISRRLAAGAPEKIPQVVISTGDESLSADAAREAGAKATIFKPFTPEELVEVVNGLMRVA